MISYQPFYLSSKQIAILETKTFYRKSIERKCRIHLTGLATAKEIAAEKNAAFSFRQYNDRPLRCWRRGRVRYWESPSVNLENAILLQLG